MITNLLANAGDVKDTSLIPEWDNPLEKEMAIHFRILAWEILWKEKPGRLQSMELRKSQT